MNRKKPFPNFQSEAFRDKFGIEYQANHLGYTPLDVHYKTWDDGKPAKEEARKEKTMTLVGTSPKVLLNLLNAIMGEEGKGAG